MSSPHLTEHVHVEEAYPEVWKTKQYLAGVIDSEGSFLVRPDYDAKTKRWFLHHWFDIKLLATKEWVKIADYLQSIYGGHIYVVARYYYRWMLITAQELLRFLNDFIPYLSIKRTDAERLRESLLAYMEIVDKGKPTAEYWREWIRRFGLREFKPLVVPLSTSE